MSKIIILFKLLHSVSAFRWFSNFAPFTPRCWPCANASLSACSLLNSNKWERIQFITLACPICVGRIAKCLSILLGCIWTYQVVCTLKWICQLGVTLMLFTSFFFLFHHGMQLYKMRFSCWYQSLSLPLIDIYNPWEISFSFLACFCHSLWMRTHAGSSESAGEAFYCAIKEKNNAAWVLCFSIVICNKSKKNCN